jgi:tight adherence protein B
VSTTPPDLNIGVSVTVGESTGEDSSVVLNERGKVGGPQPQPPAGPLVPFFGGSKIGLLIGIAGVFAGLAIFLGLLLYRPEGKRAEQLLARGLRLYTRGGKEKKKKAQGEGFLGGSAVGRAAMELAERVPRSKQFDEKMQLQLDQAGWPLRSTEFILFQVGGVVLGAILGFGLFRSPLVGVMLMILGGLAPRLALSQRMSKRQGDFLEQLPDTLQLLSGSLQAGYGFLQALDTCAKEANPPTSTEFSRVLSEARLGMPLEEALDAMADRVGGEDFKWVVLAINIQRQVGGNLAALLTTVANTLRERQQVRRQIKVLSAEGRLSAVILVALPFVLVGYLSVVNPSYLSSLTAETVGKISIAIALVLIGIGIVWMRKIIKIDV